MAKKILFSSIGTADPTENDRDGALIHIIRYHKPDIVYLYMTERFQQIMHEDEALNIDGLSSNRYDYALQQIQKDNQHSFEYKYLFADDETYPVHQFDPMLKVFDEHITQIYRDHPEVEEILLNLSSGTPAMKNALLTLSIYNHSNVLVPIQVAGPSRRNDGAYKKGKTYIELWEENLDNSHPVPRFEPMDALPNYSNKLEKNIVQNLIEQYNYHGARAIVKTNPSAYSDIFTYYLEGVVAKYSLNPTKVGTNNKLLGGKYEIPMGSSPTEYMILWNLKLMELHEITDYIRSISPTLVHLFNALALKVYPKLKEYQQKSKDSEITWNTSKIKMNNNELYNILTGNSSKLLSHPTAQQLLNILNNYSTNISKNALSELENLREVERKLRNVAAHQTRAFSSEEIISTAHMDIYKFNDKIKGLAEKLEFVNRDQWDEYRRLNDVLINLLHE